VFECEWVGPTPKTYYPPPHQPSDHFSQPHLFAHFSFDVLARLSMLIMGICGSGKRKRAETKKIFKCGKRFRFWLDGCKLSAHELQLSRLRKKKKVKGQQKRKRERRNSLEKAKKMGSQLLPKSP